MGDIRCGQSRRCSKTSALWRFGRYLLLPIIVIIFILLESKPWLSSWLGLNPEPEKYSIGNLSVKRLSSNMRSILFGSGLIAHSARGQHFQVDIQRPAYRRFDL